MYTRNVHLREGGIFQNGEGCVKIKKETLAFLISIKNKHSKMDNLNFEELKCSDYLKNSQISTEDTKLLFQLRTRMYPVKNNFKQRYQNDLNCRLCTENLIENVVHL